MLRVDEALEIVLEQISPLAFEEVSLIDSLDRVLAEDIYAELDIPPFDNSAMDGYALSSLDVSGASPENHILIDVVEDLSAGNIARKEVGRGQAIKIMTGAPIPRGADSVVMVEETEAIGNKVRIFEKVKPLQNIRQAGEDIRKGELVLKKGQIIGPAQMGIVASMGAGTVKVAKAPRVGILATGDELVGIEENIAPGKIRDSNTYSLFGQVKKTGGIPCNLGIAKDDKSRIRAKIEEGLDYELLLISGGVSVGDYDYVKLVLSEMGAEIKFWKVAMRPGKPLVFGVINGKPIFGLPGNPVSSMVAFEVFVKPVILKMLGQKQSMKKEVDAVLEEGIKKKKGFRCFLRAQTNWEDGVYLARTTGPQGSGILNSMALANSLMILPEEAELIEKGTKVTVRFLD